MYQQLKLTVFLALVGLCWSQDKVNVSVYYESKCPDSMNFIANQLWPAWQQVAQIFTVKFYPYGFATATKNGSSYDFTCQHGPEECDGNIIHSCALKYYPDNVVNVPFISCSMSAADPPAESQNCTKKYGMDWNIINTCATGEEGPQLLYQNCVIQNALVPVVDYVPWIILNDVYTEENEVEAQINFLKLICKYYLGTKPPQCTSA